MSIIFNIIESKSTVNVVNDFVRITVADGVSVDTVNSLIDDKLTKENIIGLKLADSPEFSDTNITALSSEATYTASVWTYLVGLFATVPKSVLQHIVKVWTVIQNLAARVGILEDSYLLKYVVPVDSVGFDLTHDRYGRPFSFTDGDVVDIHFRVDAWVNNGGNLNRLNIRINDVVDSVYNYGNSFYNFMFTAGTSAKIQFSILRMYVSKGELTYYLMDKYKNSSDVYGHSLYVGFTSGLNAEKITKLTFFTNLSTSLTPAGTEIIIKKL